MNEVNNNLTLAKKMQVKFLIKIAIFKFLDFISIESPTGVRDKNLDIFIAFQKMVELEFKRNRKIEFYTDVLSVSAKKLNEICQKYSGMTTLNFIHEQLSLDIKKTFLFEDWSLKEIAYYYNFDSQSALNKFIATKFCSTPSELKERVIKDAAKAMWAIYEYPELPFEQMVKVGGVPTLRNKARFIAIPSTSGTGTEITALAVITDRENDVKYPLVSYEFLPDLSIVDGELCKTMPAHVTAHTGLDALTHCVEAYVSNIDDNYADAMAKGGIELIFANLKEAIANPTCGVARQNMHDASCLGGYAFTNAWLGIAHSMAHQIGGIFGVPHGCANAIVLPSVIRYNSKATDRHDDLAKLVGGVSTEDFALAVEKLRSECNVPASVKEYGVDINAWNAALDSMVEHAMADPCTSFNPRVLTTEDMKKMFVAVFNGDVVNF